MPLPIAYLFINVDGISLYADVSGVMREAAFISIEVTQGTSPFSLFNDGGCGPGVPLVVVIVILVIVVVVSVVVVTRQARYSINI